MLWFRRWEINEEEEINHIRKHLLENKIDIPVEQIKMMIDGQFDYMVKIGVAKKKRRKKKK